MEPGVAYLLCALQQAETAAHAGNDRQPAKAPDIAQSYTSTYCSRIIFLAALMAPPMKATTNNAAC